MTYKLNEKLKKIANYQVTNEEYLIRLDANESFIDPGEGLHKDIIDAISKIPLNRYPDDTCRELRQAFGDFYEVDPDLVVAGNGSDELISLIIGSFIKKGEKIITLVPDFSMYQIFADTFERECIQIDKDNDLYISAEEIIAKAKEAEAQAIIFSNPASPAARVMKRSQVIKIIESTNALVVVDEAYMDFSSESVIEMVEKYDNLIVLRTCSKALSSAAIRLGFAISSKEIIRVLNAIRPPYNLNAITQAIGCVVLSQPEYINKSIEAIIKGRNYLHNGVKQFINTGFIERIYESETNYIYIETTYAKQIYDELRKRSILIRKFDNSLRITVGTKEENDEVICSFGEIISSLREQGGKL